MKRLSYLLTASVSCIMIAACGGPPANNPLLVQAQREYDTARSDSLIVANAPVHLKKAEQALSKGEDAWQEGADDDVVAHYAYLATQRTEIAKEMAKLHTSEAEIQGAELERKEALLAVREQEADRSKREAESAKEEAKAATEEAGKATDVAKRATEEAVRATEEAVRATEGTVKAEREAEKAAEETEKAEREAEAAKTEAQESALEADAAKAVARTAIEDARALTLRVAELEARETERGLVITLGDILFESDKANLKPGADRALSELAAFLKEYEDRSLLVEGFTDNVGSHAYNEDLSQRRADAVRGALTAKGIDGSRIRTHGLGEEYPVATNETEAGRQQNRRVDIVISDESGEIPNRGS